MNKKIWILRQTRHDKSVNVLGASELVPALMAQFERWESPPQFKYDDYYNYYSARHSVPRFNNTPEESIYVIEQVSFIE